MKTMTCKQMGGPCDAPIKGSTPDEMMANGGKHVNDMAATGDAAHIETKKQMDAMGGDPNSDANKQWMEKFHTDFAATPDDVN